MLQLVPLNTSTIVCIRAMIELLSKFCIDDSAGSSTNQAAMDVDEIVNYLELLHVMRFTLHLEHH